MVSQRTLSITPIQITRKMKVVIRNPSHSTTRAKKMRIATPRRGRSHDRCGQNGTEGIPFSRLLPKIRISENMMRTMARPKGKKPGPGCFNLPMERWIALQAVMTPIARRMYPVTRSHFSISLFLRSIQLMSLISLKMLSKFHEFFDGLAMTFRGFIRNAERK